MVPVTRFLGSIGSLLALLALLPKELQSQIPQLFPEQYRGKIGILLALLVFVSRYITSRAETRRASQGIPESAGGCGRWIAAESSGSQATVAPCGLTEATYSEPPPPKYQPQIKPTKKMKNISSNNDGNTSRLTIDLLFAACILVLASCAWTKAHQNQIQAVSEVALEHLAGDAYAIGLQALRNEINSGFNANLGYALQTSTREVLPTLVSSQRLADYLRAWNTPATDQLARLVPEGLDAPSAQKVALVLVDSQAAAIPAR
jgi:hypothetical protein